jgi:hypothetical protein
LYSMSGIRVNLHPSRSSSIGINGEWSQIFSRVSLFPPNRPLYIQVHCHRPRAVCAWLVTLDLARARKRERAWPEAR